MTGRIRSIKPEWIDSERFCSCSDAAIRLSFVFFALVDDDGRVRISVRALGMRAWGFCDDVADKTAKTRSALDELIAVDWVEEYEVDGVSCWQIKNWAKHQKIDKHRPSRLPAPPPREESRALARSREESRGVAPDLDLDLDHGSGKGSGAGAVARAREPEPTPAAAPTSAHMDSFSRSFAQTSDVERSVADVVSATRQEAGGAAWVPTGWKDRECLQKLAEWSSASTIGPDRLRAALVAFWAAKGTGARLSYLTEEDPGRYLGSVPSKRGHHVRALPNSAYQTDLTDLDRILGGNNVG